ncbi:nuclear transport factor 2 family protein [Halalkalicoccus sp. NIPERK01]|uniref:nuclear transport factor 2 family protein n=1 Tax=Halalkalicoccus sp. NIPERK01 TaxID=3053469 RepID=UPI00256F1187|nr:nuclear transport factor 2 family protein [Halalkalicoccus sp. NIPERK01]MDL5362331.1 nuclear transport factor 2 family protein [Halalkalicoccus sp. NIPERK01]
MDAVREYYRTIDSHAYDDLAELLAPDFIHYRPDRTIEGREAFVAFMREKRPMKDTTHEITAVYEADGGVAVRGRLLDGDGEGLFDFIDCFEFEDGDVAAVHTYTR